MGIKDLTKDPTFAGLCLGYAILSGMRKTLSVSLPMLMADLELSKSDVGVIASNFALAYGLILSMTFGFGWNLKFLCIVWFMSGCVQGLGWPALSTIIFDQYSQAERGTVWSAATASGNIGYIVGPFIFNALLKFGWRAPFVAAGGVGIIVAGIVLQLIPDKPRAIVSTTPRNTSGDASFTSLAAESAALKTSSKAGPTGVNEWLEKWSWLASAPLCCLLVSSGFTMFQLRAVSDWSALYFVETLAWDNTRATFFSFWSEVGGMVGSISAGIVSDTLVYQKRDVTSCIYAAVSIPAILGIALIMPTLKASGAVDGLVQFSSSSVDSFSIWLAICMFSVGVGINGPKTLMGMCAREGVPAGRVGLVGGILGVIGQLGSAVAGGVLGWLLEKYGWHVFLPVLGTAASACLCLIVIYTVCNIRKQPHLE